MSTHYTSSKVPLVRMIKWKRLVFEILVPLLFIIFAISAWVDNVPYKFHVLGAAWAYIFILVGKVGGSQRALQFHAGAGAAFFIATGIVSLVYGSAEPPLSSYLMAGLVLGTIVTVVQAHIRIDRLEARGVSGRSADFPGIYRITCSPNGKQYIGQTSQAINARWAEHRAHLGGRRHHNRWLQADWDLYRPEQFIWEVLEVVTDPVWLLDRERCWQDVDYDANKRYNPPNIAPRIAKASSRPPMKRKQRAH